MIQEVEVILNNDVVTVVKYGDVYVQFPSIHRKAKTIYVKYKWGQYSIVDDYTPPEEEPAENDDFERAMNSYLSKHDIFLLTSDLATAEEFEGELGFAFSSNTVEESSSETNDNGKEQGNDLTDGDIDNSTTDNESTDEEEEGE